MSAPADLTAFVRAEQPRLVRAMSLLLDDRMVAEEVVQEAFVRAASRWEHVRHLDSPGGWTHRVAVNLATSQLRRRRIERRARHRMAREDVAPAPDTATALVVRQAVKELPAGHRQVLVLRHVLDWSVAEIAALDGSSNEAVRQRLHRARTALRHRLGITDDGNDHATTTELEETSDAR